MFLINPSHMSWRGPRATSLELEALAGWGACHRCPHFPLSRNCSLPSVFRGSQAVTPGVWEGRDTPTSGQQMVFKTYHTHLLGIGSLLTTDPAQVVTTQTNYCAWKRHPHFTDLLTLLRASQRSFSV